MADEGFVDRARTVREGEQLDLERLAPYLREHIPGLEGALEVKQFPSGYSNLTYLLQAGDRELVLRRPPFGANVKSGHDMAREYRILSHLVGHYEKVPRPLLYYGEDDLIGDEFYVMERARGLILRAEQPEKLALPPELMQALSATLVENLVAIHAVDYEAAGLGDLGRPEGYVRRQIEGWTRRYRKAQTDDVPQVEEVASWLASHMPPESGAALIHNDYKYDNLVLNPARPTEIVAVLDWEMATIGDPLMDLGTSLGYWVEADDPPLLQALAFGPTALPGNYNRRELFERYSELSGREGGHPVFYFVYGLFKIIGIVQQIYYRYRQGFTQDPRFAMLDQVVVLLAQQAGRAIERERIDKLG